MPELQPQSIQRTSETQSFTLHHNIRRVAWRGAVVFAAAVAPVIMHDSAAAAPGQSPTTHKDSGPKCLEGFNAVGNGFPIEPAYLRVIKTYNATKELHERTIESLRGPSTDSINLICDTPQENSPSNS